MIHFSCDRCQRPIDAKQAVRYVVKMEIEATLNTSGNDHGDDDQDSLLEMDQMLERLEEDALDEDNPVLYQRQRFDLCPDCYKQFVRNPFGREKVVPFGFSHN